MLASTQTEPRASDMPRAEAGTAMEFRNRSPKPCATFLVAAGGTGGHVFPGIEVARELRSRGHQCVFVGTERGQERRLVPDAGFPIEFLQVGALKMVAARQRLRTLLQIPDSLLKAAAILERSRPAAVLSLGGYSSGPLMVMAIMREIPVVIMEPNAKPGLANRLAGPFASWALVGFPSAEAYFRRGRTEVSGIPIRREFFSLPPKDHRPPFTVLITGGSQGSLRLNRAAAEALPIWASRGRLSEMRFLHQTGSNQYNEVRAAYEAHGANAVVAAFFDDMPQAFAEADLVVCRAGASTVAELSAAGKASILVPYPFAADQHQLRNAEAMEAAGAARVVPDSAWTGERFVDEAERLLQTPAVLMAMEQAARRQARPGAAERAANVLERLAAQRSQ